MPSHYPRGPATTWNTTNPLTQTFGTTEEPTTARDEILKALPRLRARLGRDVFTPEEVIQELPGAGIVDRDSTFRTHVNARMWANAPDNHAVVFNDFERVGRGLYRQRQS